MSESHDLGDYTICNQDSVEFYDVHNSWVLKCGYNGYGRIACDTLCLDYGGLCCLT